MERESIANLWLVGGGEMGDLIRRRDWSLTPLGPLASWPQSLRTTVSLCLASNFPINLIWGPGSHTQIINDGYRVICGARYLQVMGEDYAVSWASAWEVIGEAFDRAWQGETSFLENQRMFLERNGYLEETFFTFSLSPIRDETGAVAGLFHPVTETTTKMLSERRSRTLRELSASIGNAKERREVLSLASQSLQLNDFDLPFVLFYEADSAKGHSVSLVASAGVQPGSHLCLKEFGEYTPWTRGRSTKTRRFSVVENLSTIFGPIHCGPYEDPPQNAVLMPLTLPGTTEPMGYIVAGVSARLQLDEAYDDFYASIAATINAAVANAAAYESERARSEALAELDRSKTAFFSNVSHEFRTPLTLIIGPLEDALAAANETLSPRLLGSLQIAQRNSLRLLRLVNSLLDFSRLEAGRTYAIFRPTDLALYTANLASGFTSAMQKAGLKFTVDCPPLPAPVYVDLDMWEKIVLNLLSNALKFTLEGYVSVRVRVQDGAAQLEIEDSGAGIPESEQENVFKRFHRIESTKARTIEGSGIGLALVKELVKLHGGSIGLQSCVGQGAVFRVTLAFGSAHLPQTQVKQEQYVSTSGGSNNAYLEEALRWIPESSKVEEEPIATQALEHSVETSVLDHRPRILLAEDNSDMREYVLALLSPVYDVTATVDGAEALEKLQISPYDLVLSDIMMPRLDGLRLLRSLRAHDTLKSMPVILLSARAGEEATVEGIDTGADDYLTKPFSSQELLARVRRALAMARLRSEAESLRVDREGAFRSNRLKDEFLATLAHELRTPLNAIRGFSELLGLDGETPKEREESIEAIHRNVEAQTRIIDELIDVSRIVTGNLTLDVSTIKLSDLIETAVKNAALMAQTKKIDIETTIDRSGEMVVGDANRLQQVLWNLLSNAIKFTPEKGRVSITLRRHLNSAELAISDTGQGIDAKFLPFVFDLFRQQDGSNTRRHGGLGLGLSITKKIVDAHGGTITAASAGTGTGATFYVVLPLAAIQIGPEASTTEHITLDSKPDKLRVLSGIRILVVDDHSDSRKLVASLLRKAGADVIVAETAAEAYAMLQESLPHVFLSDIGMPDESGYDLIRRVRRLDVEHGGATPAAALTAWAREEDVREALTAGFQTHISKPISSNSVIAAVAALAGLDVKQG